MRMCVKHMDKCSIFFRGNKSIYWFFGFCETSRWIGSCVYICALRCVHFYWCIEKSQQHKKSPCAHYNNRRSTGLSLEFFWYAVASRVIYSKKEPSRPLTKQKKKNAAWFSDVNVRFSIKKKCWTKSMQRSWNESIMKMVQKDFFWNIKIYDQVMTWCRIIHVVFAYEGYFVRGCFNWSNEKCH